MLFSTCRPGKTNVNIETIFGTGDYVGETNKHAKFGWDRFTGGASTQWWNITFVTFVLPFFYIFFCVSSSRLQVAIFNRFARLIAQTTCSVSYTCLLGVWCLKIHFQGVSGPKNTKISTRFRTWPICSGNLFSIRALRSKLPLNVKITPQKLDFWLEVTNQEFLSHNGGSTGRVIFKMAAAAILNFENWLPFHYYWTNRHQIWLECWESDIERNCCIQNAYSPKFKMATAAFLNFEKRLPYNYYWINRHQIWWECWEYAIEHNCHIKMHIHQN